MDSYPTKKFRMKVLFGSGIVLLGVLAILLWKTGNSATSVEAKETASSKKKDSASLSKIVHRSIISERGWYTSDAEALNKEIAGYYQKAEVKPISNVMAMVLPHAGYRFSGQIAVRALKTANNTWKRC
ncbi:MAG: AmmeMemoRadiSam system protein B [Planctomycetota bacterium]|jgi:hypothetical protein